MSEYKSVAVITSTIGRSELERAILSVQNQTYPCTHYVFVDGQQYWEKAQQILVKYPNVVVTYLPMNTGADGWSNSSINAIAPYLAKEDIITYLDDDNWYQPNHIQTGVETLLKSGADYAYALRNFYSHTNEFICEDVLESTGFYPRKIGKTYFDIEYHGGKVQCMRERHKSYHIDTNCYFMPRNIALKISPNWYSGYHNDTNVFKTLCELELKPECTKHFTVNYAFEAKKQDPAFFQYWEEKVGLEKAYSYYYETLRQETALNMQKNGGKYAWDL